jgi:tetratricopeptide (TPR) repeat protein
VAIRDGGIRAVVAGEVRKIGSSYLLSAEVTSPADGITVASLSEEALKEAGLLTAMERLAAKVRSVLGESLASPLQVNEPLSRVSTPSLRALQLYSQAHELLVAENLGGPDRNGAAAILLREAIAEDPGFASAHLLLAWAVFRQGGSSEEFLPHADRALGLVETVGEREAYFIRASQLSLSDEDEAAIPIYRALVERYPDHFWAQQNLGYHLGVMGRHHEALEAFTELVSQRPNNFTLQNQLAFETVRLRGLEAALPHVERARSLMRPDSVGETGAWAYAWLETLPAWKLWLRGDLEGVAAEVARVDQLIAEAPAGARREQLIWYIEGPDSVLGRLSRAERWADMDTDDRRQRQERLTHLYVRGDMEEIGRWLDTHTAGLDQGTGWISPLVPPLLAQLGRLDTFNALIASGRLLMPELAKAHFDLARGRLEEAVRGFEETIPKLASRNSRYFLAMQALAEVHRQLGDLDKARLLLEEASSQRSHVPATGSGKFWLLHQIHLADFYREQGLIQEAQAVESELLELLALADTDHPLLIEVQERVGTRL